MDHDAPETLSDRTLKNPDDEEMQSSKTSPAMTDADLLPIKLPKKYNYTIWEDPALASEKVEEPVQGNSFLTDVDIDQRFPEDLKENRENPTPIRLQEVITVDETMGQQESGRISLLGLTEEAGPHAFSPFKAHQKERALKALDSAIHPDIEVTKPSFFDEFGRSLFRKSALTMNGARATKINLFQNMGRYHQLRKKYRSNRPSSPYTKPELRKEDASVKKVEALQKVVPEPRRSLDSPVEIVIVDDKVEVREPEPVWAKPAPKQKNAPTSNNEASTSGLLGASSTSAFKPIGVLQPISRPIDIQKPKNKKRFVAPETPFNTPLLNSYSRSLPKNFGGTEHSSRELGLPRGTVGSAEQKRNLRPRPTRPPTLFGFSSDMSEDETNHQLPPSARKRRK